MSIHGIYVNSRLEELNPEIQLALVRLINSIAEDNAEGRACAMGKISQIYGRGFYLPPDIEQRLKTSASKRKEVKNV